MKTFLTILTVMLACLLGRSANVPFSSPPFDPKVFTVNLAGNFIGIHTLSTNDPFGSTMTVLWANTTGTNLFYVVGLLTNNTTGSAHSATNAPDGMVLNDSITNNIYTNAGPDILIRDHTAFLNTNSFGEAGGSLVSGLYVNTGPDTSVSAGVLLLNTNKFLAPVDSRPFTNLNTGFNEIDGQLIVKKSVGIGPVPDIVLNQDGSAQFDSGNVTISLAGNVGAISLTGDGSGITALNASQLATGLAPPARLGTGTPNALKFLRGDSFWAFAVTNVVYTNAGAASLLVDDTIFLNTNVISGGGGSGGITQLTGDVTAGPGSGSVPATLANIPTATPMAGYLLDTAIVAPSTPASGKGAIYQDSTSKNISIKSDAGIVNHGVQSRTSTTSQWIKSIADDGSSTISQPTYPDISGTLSLSSAVFANQGTTITVLHGNAAGNPSFGAVALATDVSGNLPVANLNSGTSASASTFWRGDGTWATATGASGISALTGDVTATGPGSAVATVVGINGTILSTLPSGLIYNTTGTGVPTTKATWTSVAAVLTTLIPQSALGTGSAGTGLNFLADDQTYKPISSSGGLSNQLAGAIQHLAFNIITNITPGNGSGMAVGDMNTDGIPDIVVDANAATIVYTNIRNGTLFPRASTFSQTSTAGGVALADVDANGTLDAIASSRTGNYINVLTNAGDGTLVQLGGNYSFGSGGPNFISIFTGKIDANNSQDFLAINGTIATVYTNDGIGNFAVSTNLPAPVAASTDAAVGDINGNGTNDMVFWCSTAITANNFGFVTMTNNGAGVFLFYSTNNLQSALPSALAIALGDFNGDGRNDVLLSEKVAASSITSVQIFTNNGNGFGIYSSNVVDTASSAKLVVSDFNQDGKMDFAVSLNTSAETVVYTNAGFGRGVAAAITNTSSATTPLFTGAADFSGEGWPDLAVYQTAGSGGVNVWLNTPNIAGNHYGDGSHLTNGQITVIFNAGAVTPANSWTPGPPAAAMSPFGSLTVNSNYAPYIANFVAPVVNGNGLNMTNISFCTTSASSSGTVTSLNTHQIEMTYMSSGSTIVSMTWALPTSTTLGKIFYLHSKSAITTLTVTGGSFIDAAVVTMTAGQTIGFETIDGSGTYIRLQ